MTTSEKALMLHEQWNGKLETVSKTPVKSREDLALAYTPGVAEPCKVIAQDKSAAYTYTMKANTVAVVSDGSAVLGLGNIGPYAAMPVMEGKAVLFKEFGGINAVPICLDTQDTEEIIKAVTWMAPGFGGINLEDISAPRCFEIEERLKAALDIPVFHDDQHGTAIVTAAALSNALRLVDKKREDVTVAINGAGAAGIAIANFLLKSGVKDVILCDSRGIICEGDPRLNSVKAEIASRTNRNRVTGGLANAMKGADVFVGVSVANCVGKEMVRSMKDGAIVFTCANPTPEIAREDALEAGAAIVGTGSSEKPNQINNVLVFPGLFRGALDVRAREINFEMMFAASEAIASAVGDKLSADYILPYAFEQRAHDAVAAAVAAAARKTGAARL